MSGQLDSCRFRYFISQTLNVPVSAVHAIVIGEHGESMLPLPQYSTVNGKPLTELMSHEEIQKLIEGTRKTAADVIALKGGTVYAPGNAVGSMVEAIMKDKHEQMLLSTYLNGEYGVKGLYIGVPAVLGRNGVEKIVEFNLDEEQKTVFMKGVDSIKNAISGINRG
jgi:malate dehydrogenase